MKEDFSLLIAAMIGLEENRHLVLRDEIERGSWTFILKPVGGDRTRLIIRARGDAPDDMGGKFFHYVFFEPAHFIMERKMLLTLKEKAERKDLIESEKSARITA